MTAPSNAAVANLALKLVSTGRFRTRDVVVWGENCDESVRFLNPIHRDRRWAGFFRSYRESQDDGTKKKKFDAFVSWLRMDLKQASLTETAALCRLAADDISGHKSVASAKVILCTLNTAGSTSLREATKCTFDLIVLDEASQAPEAEFYITTTFPGVKRIVVVGDPRQLPATVVHQGCRDAGFADSFLSHVQQFQPEKVHLLDTQYRMDPEILRFSNECFYSNRVISDESVHLREPVVESPFQIIDTSEMGEERISRGGMIMKRLSSSPYCAKMKTYVVFMRQALQPGQL